MSQRSGGYTLGFAGAVAGVCALLVTGSAVTLKPLQELNKKLEKQKHVLTVAGLMEEGAEWTADKIQSTYDARVRAKLVDMKTGEISDKMEAVGYDQRAAMRDDTLSQPAPPNLSKVARVPNLGLIYEVTNESGKVDKIILPISGMGLWSTLWGFLALEADGQTVAGLTYYEHGETPGLGGEVENPRWRALWPGRKIFDGKGDVALQVIKGAAPPVGEDPYKVDGLSGATITSRGVTNMLRFWAGAQGYGPYLQKLRGKG